MDGSIYQQIFLTIAAQQQVVGLDMHPAVYANGAMRHVGQLEFQLSSESSETNREVVADSVAGWQSFLRSEAIVSAQLSYIEQDSLSRDRTGAGLVGRGGNWLIHTGLAQTNIGWALSQSLIEPRPADGKIWRYSYRGAVEPPPPQAPNREGARDGLHQALVAIDSFARDNGLEFWADNHFQPAISAFDQNLVSAPNWTGLSGLGIHPDRKSLLGICFRAWVFGGMGSWNDVDPGRSSSARAGYEEVSDRLFLATVNAILAATNDTRVI